MNQPQPRPGTNPAQTYEAFFVPYQFRPWTEELLDRAKPQPGERVLDAACGTGIVARMVAQRTNGQARVVGLDVSPAMLEVARSAAAREGAEIAWHEGSAESLPFPDASFDLVVVQQGLQFFRDKAGATRELSRILGAGGRAATSTWTEVANNPLFEILSGLVQKHLGMPALQMPFSLGDQETLRSLFVDAGFRAVEIERVTRTVRFPSNDMFVDLTLASAAAAVPALQSMSEAVRAEMEAPRQAYTEGDELVFPMETHIVIARKAR
ncbi:MAG: class I SAM-dependent methyltransferase [Chloroflexota bacterium]|nr:class I SAM-dependent methyltransferase [Chloroflexota bacterium]